MTLHPESEHLSALLDGELSAVERAPVEAHLATCAECQSVEAALRATTAELKALPTPMLTEQETWALRSAITKARRTSGRAPSSRARRIYAASGVAAVLIAIGVSIPMLTSSSSEDRATATADFALNRAAVVVSDTDYTRDSAEALLDPTVPGAARDATAPRAALNMEAASPQPGFLGGPAGGGAVNKDTQAAVTDDEIARCESHIFGDKGRSASDRGARHATSIIAAKYQGSPALFLVYAVTSPRRTELWVVKRATCDVLLFSQRNR